MGTAQGMWPGGAPTAMTVRGKTSPAPHPGFAPPKGLSCVKSEHWPPEAFPEVPKHPVRGEVV